MNTQTMICKKKLIIVSSLYILMDIHIIFLKELIFAQSLTSLVKVIIILMEKKVQLIHNMQKQMGGQSLSPQEKTVVAIHALNIFNKLRCVNDKYQICEFPENWRNKQKGEYLFSYILHKEKGVMKFKFTPHQQKLVVIFGYEGSKQINKVELDKNLSLEEIVKKYQFNLHQFLTTQTPQSQKPFYHFSHQEPDKPQIVQTQKKKQSVHPVSQLPEFIEKTPYSYPPQNVFSSQQATNPFGQEEYVGPKSEIFHNPYFQQTKVPSNLKVPPGARYDPTDPFDDPFKQKKEGPDDFVGFDQFGAPIQPQKKQINPKQFKPLPKESKPGFDLENKKGGFGGKQPSV